MTDREGKLVKWKKEWNEEIEKWRIKRQKERKERNINRVERDRNREERINVGRTEGERIQQIKTENQ